MAYRITDAKVEKIDIAKNKLVIKARRLDTGEVRYLKTCFTIDNNTLITAKDNRSLILSDIKVGNKVTVDSMKMKNRKLLAKGICILN